ncbi:aldo/keto reductase [Lacticaseibacillus thailandensis]|uniref:Aldo keto reductase n=1 Tax=Lacticaseibacillus thailandensis DSM 22698 = JCM 13996 TaxID=1423810 RepID=A0A0R2CFV7_9LACO|nr:aldo/keto reductase [Lacticaseibacillus thailandensis]KRM86531.1 aldo keto reductase [Lacticaseibacillus thailandensis DSM 22698 = JCM 13996]
MTKTITIGHSEVTSGPLGLGTNKVGGHNLFPGLNDDDGRAVVRAALDHGVKTLDTAFMYGVGRSEELIGEVLRDYKREDVVIADKGAQDPDQDLHPNNRPEFLTRAVDAALQRLGTDYIDIFYIHFPDADTPKYEAVGALQRLKEAGKIRAIGVSNFKPAQVQEANQDGYVDVVEDAYSLVQRDAEQQLFPYLQQQGISFVPYYPLASGILTGKYTGDEQFGPDDWQSHNPNFQGARFKQIVAGMDRVKDIAAAHHVTPSQLVLAWYIQNPAVAVVIPGARKAAQVEQNAQTLSVTLTADEYQAIDGVFTNLPD